MIGTKNGLKLLVKFCSKRLAENNRCSAATHETPADLVRIEDNHDPFLEFPSNIDKAVLCLVGEVDLRQDKVLSPPPFSSFSAIISQGLALCYTVGTVKKQSQQGFQSAF